MPSIISSILGALTVFQISSFLKCSMRISKFTLWHFTFLSAKQGLTHTHTRSLSGVIQTLVRANLTVNITSLKIRQPVPVAARSKRRSAATCCWDCGFKSHWRHGCLSVVCCQVEVSVMNWSHVQRSSTNCGALLCVWYRNLVNEEALTQWGLLRQKQTI